MTFAGHMARLMEVRLYNACTNYVKNMLMMKLQSKSCVHALKMFIRY